jgi:hypothetical protein
VLGKPTQQALQLFAIAILFVFTPRILAGEIALTFDDAPMRGTAIMSGNERTEKLIATLKENKVPDVLFLLPPKTLTPRAVNELNAIPMQVFTWAAIVIAINQPTK